MIPRVIHYCWFGKGEKPLIVRKCIQSWKEVLPDYEIVEWNEDNFDVTKSAYVKEAYDMKKYAFVSDVARLEALYQYGGFYMDTDVEVLKSFEPLLRYECILGFEEANYIATSFMGAKKGNLLIKEFLSLYEGMCFVKPDGSFNIGTNVTKLTNILKGRGLRLDNSLQLLGEEITVFPKEYFSPYDYINCVYEITKESYCVHHFYVSWMPVTTRITKSIKKVLIKVVGKQTLIRLRHVLRKGKNEDNN